MSAKVISSVFVLSVFAFCVVPAVADVSALQAFAEWVGQNKVQSRANLGLFDGARIGGVAGSNIASGDFILRVPASIMITPEVYGKDPINQYDDFKLSYEPLMLWLLKERINPDSFWKPYIGSLPASFEGHPMFWTNEQLALTEGTGLAENVLSRRQTLEAAYKLLNENYIAKNNILPAEYFTYDNYLWSFMVVLTRAWFVQDQLVLVPMADMLNHSPDAGAGNLEEVDGQYFFVINATKDYASGEQVFDSYGARSNFELMKGYGFALENNPHDSMLLHFNMKTTNLVQGIVEPLLRKADPNYGTITIQPNRRPDALLRIFRLSVMEFKDLEHVEDALAGKPISLMNELKAYRAAISGLAQALQKFPTTVEEDSALLQTELSAIERNAVIFRRSEKQILQNCILVLGKMWENILIEGQLPVGVPLR